MLFHRTAVLPPIPIIILTQIPQKPLGESSASWILSRVNEQMAALLGRVSQMNEDCIAGSSATIGHAERLERTSLNDGSRIVDFLLGLTSSLLFDKSLTGTLLDLNSKLDDGFPRRCECMMPVRLAISFSASFQNIPSAARGGTAISLATFNHSSDLCLKSNGAVSIMTLSGTDSRHT